MIYLNESIPNEKFSRFHLRYIQNGTEEKLEDLNWFEYVQPEDLLQFGLIPEFIGRLPVHAPLKELSEKALYSILVEPKNALTKQFKGLFDLDDIALEFDDEALLFMARIAKKQEIGARALRGIMEQVLLDSMFELPKSKTSKAVKGAKKGAKTIKISMADLWAMLEKNRSSSFVEMLKADLKKNPLAAIKKAAAVKKKK